MEELKQKYFPHSPDEPVILHREDILQRKGPFWVLRDEEKRRDFNEELLQFMTVQCYHVITVVIDKKVHIERYGESAYHPYHYCLATMLERYCGFLNFYNAEGDVLAESRGRTEDLQLKEAYRLIYRVGSQWRGFEFFQRALTSSEMKVKQKQANIAGLQLCDLIAYPSKQDILTADSRIDDPGGIFGKQICKCIESKYNRQVYENRIEGYGKVFLK